ncbi:hypothetical protein HA402_005675 [Bradysia odoriphaga]|nr:hypothetical protein HA402_005675 [Bradysia odoriphaga]
MAEQYDTNGDFNYADGSSSDFKRREKNATSEKSDDEEDHPIAEKVSEYLRELLSEKVSIDHKYPHAERLLEQGFISLKFIVIECPFQSNGIYLIYLKIQGLFFYLI